MFETYDTTKNAYVEHVGEYYDTNEKAWVEVQSAMTYDTNEKAWVERLDLDNYFTEQVFTFQHGGSYTVSSDKRTITFNFKSGSYGTIDSASLIWEGKPVTDGLFMGSFETSDSNTNPDVYFYYLDQQVKTSKLKTQSDNIFAINCQGLTVDKIIINIVPYNASTFSLINLFFGKALKFEIERS